MESEKVKEIKKALECCYILTNKDLPMETRDNACNNCPYDGIERCLPLLVKNSLTYINELESENESCYEVLADLKAIIKQQNDRIAELEKENDKQLKQFAERVKGYIHSCENISNSADEDLCERIDETLNELQGE